MVMTTLPTKPPAAVWLAAGCAWGAAIANLVAVLISGFALYVSHSWREVGSGQFLLLVAIVGALTLAPAAAGTFTIFGRRRSRAALATITALAALSSGASPMAWGTTAMLATSVAVLCVPTASSFLRAGDRSAGMNLSGGRSRTATDAYVWLAFFGILGAHLFYVRRGWQGVIYASVLALALLSTPSLLSALMIAALLLCCSIDVSRVPEWVKRANL